MATINTTLYGRKWELKIGCNDGETFILSNDGFKNKRESLKVTFDINYPRYESLPLAEFNIWNPTVETERKIIMEGATVEFSAGYSDGKYGSIFTGTIFQSLFTRENVTDYRLTLMCVDGHRLYQDNMSIFTLKEYSDMTLINEIAARSKNPIPINKVSSKIDNTTKPRGVSVMAVPATPLREVARNNGAQMYMTNDKLNVSKVDDDVQKEGVVVNPKTGLIGTPTQIDYGIQFRTLLNPEFMLTYPAKWVKLDMSQINVKMQKIAGPNPNNPPVALMPQDGYFLIGGVSHFGDTRGDEWYSEVIGYSLLGKMDLRLATVEMMQKGQGNPN